MSDVEDEVMQAGEEEEEVEEEVEEEDDQDEDDDDMNQEDDGGESASTSKKGGGSSSKSNPSTAGSKKTAPNKRKTPSSATTPSAASASAASSSAKNAKKPKLITNEATAKETVRAYMKQQNRPYTALIVFENLHHAIKKPTLIRIMDELVEEGHLQAKDFKKVRIYMAKQLDSDTCTPAELDALSAREASLRESLVEQRAKNSKLEGQIRALQSEPSDDELAKLLAQYKKQIDALNTKLARFKNDKNLVTKESMNKAQANFNECFKQWKLRKRAADDLIGQMCGDEGDPKDVCERFRLETDEEAGDKIADWKDLAKDLPKK